MSSVSLFFSLASNRQVYFAHSRIWFGYVARSLCDVPRNEASSGESNQPATTANPALVQQVFVLFKDYLLTQLDAKGKEIETKQKIDKETVELKFKGQPKAV